MSTRAPLESLSQPAFDLKATSFTLPVLKLLVPDVQAIAAGLTAKIAEAPQFFHNTPLVIDVQTLRGQGAAVNFALLLGTLRGKGLIPVGITGGDEEQNEMAITMELAVLAGTTPPRARPAARQVEPQGSPGRVATQPVRSGQRIYAAGGDLTVLGPVSSGAEVFADGNVHVYGCLRGRALAGVKGDASARIFCTDLRAELVSVAGVYRVSEDIAEGFGGRTAQVYLEDGRLRIAAL